MGEIIVTPKDVYRILRISITGELVVYDVEESGGIDAMREVFVDPQIASYSVAWQDMVDNYGPLLSVLAGLNGSFLIPDKRFPRLTWPREPIPALDEVDDDDDQGGEGGCQGGGRGPGRGRRVARGGVIGNGRRAGGGRGGGYEGGDGRGGGRGERGR
ncbi:uncharacterized protein LOC131857610 [Cryptomeria japonica]|uniref:uncharacterized protein LOC131857610 n=1 Tax=Cryptomeria japonica TaxID=3369 RepID=UPI0027DA04B7|nr:uncharacterized protein LOC131857610 [Cryptomeria japonica]